MKGYSSTMNRKLESPKVKAPQLLLLSVFLAIGAIIWSDIMEDALIDGYGFNYVLAIIGTLFLIAAILTYEFENAYAKLYAPA